MNKVNDPYKKSRVLYIISATLEYFISILTGTAYLAKIAGSVGISDGTIGVLSSFVSLGCAFQIVSIAMRTDKPVKRTVTVINLINQLCFTLLYVIPVVNLSRNVKTIVFIVLLLLGNILLNVPFSPKVVWSRTLIPDNKRGIFSASCEMTSLISGMIFTILTGRLIDRFEEAGNQTAAFSVCAIVLLVITVSHALCLLFMREDKRTSDSDNDKLLERLRRAITNKTTITLIPVFVLWNIALYITTPFFGTYQINDLGLNMTVISLISTAYSIIRTIVSAPIGILGDKKSFILSTTLALCAMTVGLAVNCIGGVASHVIFYVMYAITMAGMNNGIMNLIFDYVPHSDRSGSVSILYTIGGLVGFLATLAVKPLVDIVQANGNRIWFMEHVYAQQILSAIGAIFTIALITYINLVVKKLDKVNTK